MSSNSFTGSALLATINVDSDFFIAKKVFFNFADLVGISSVFVLTSFYIDDMYKE